MSNKLKNLLTVLISFCFFTLNSPSAVNAGSTPPSTTYEQTPSSPDGDNGWYVTPIRFDLTSTDLNSGVKEINYRLDGGTWQTVSFSDTLNLVPNPSFETSGATTSDLLYWDTTTQDAQTTYSQDTTEWAPSYNTASAKISTTGVGWHGINHKTNFAVTYAYENMSASIWMKTLNVTGSAYFKVYAISEDEFGNEVVTLIDQSAAISGTTGWTNLSVEFVSLPESITGVYVDIGLDGSGTVWADAVTLNSSSSSAQTSVTISDDGENHTFEFYAVDNAGNTEVYSCATSTNCVEFDLDTTPPGNWHDSGAFRGWFFGSDHELYVYTNVEDATSGLSTFTDKYQYHTEREPGFGRYDYLLSCSSDWEPNNWVILISPPFFPGSNSAFLLTPKTDFCNSNWKICKTVRFYAEDLAGNSATKDFCINGLWIKVRGEGYVRANQNIDMIAEPEDENTDSLIEVGGNVIDFFTSTRNWSVYNSPTPEDYGYSTLWDKVDETKTEITSDLVSSDGIYYTTGNFEIDNQSIPNDYDNNTFDQVVFIDGNLTISKDIDIDDTSTALFVVSGNVEIEKSVREVGIAIIADGYIDTAYDIEEGDSTQTVELNGLYHANEFLFKRTLQGTNNNDDPSETINYEPKYLMNLKDLFGNYTVQWKSIE